MSPQKFYDKKKCYGGIAEGIPLRRKVRAGTPPGGRGGARMGACRLGILAPELPLELEA